MRTTYFTTHLQAVSGLVEVVSTHQVAGIIQSSKPTESTEQQVSQIIQALSHTAPQTPQHAKTLLDTKGVGLDMALLVHHEGRGILVTQGTGVIFLKRNEKLTEVVGNGLIAQGLVHDHDEFILTTDEFLDLIGGLEGMTYYFLKYPSEEVVEMMKTYEDQSVAAGFVAVLFGAQKEPSVIEEASQEKEQTQDTSPAGSVASVEKIPNLQETTIPQDHFIEEVDVEENEVIVEKGPSMVFRFVRKITQLIMPRMTVVWGLLRQKPKLLLGGGVAFVVVLALLGRLLFSASAVLPKTTQSFDLVRTNIEALLTSADTEAFVNVTGVESLITSARSALENLSAADKRRYKAEIDELSKIIASKEQKHLRISTSVPKEHFVLSLEASDARVTDADFDGETFYLLDSPKGAVYVVSSESRAYVPLRSDKLKNARAVTGLGDDIYVLTANEGIYYVTSERSIQVIKPDSQWGMVTDIKVYAGNIYLLDAKRKNIYKYPGADEKTFGTATSYLVEEAQGNLESNSLLAIDGFVYAAGTTSVLKFASGRKADLRLVLPYKEISITALYAHADVEKLYIFDATHQALLELTKEGVFDKQWKMPESKALAIGVLETGKKFVVTEKSILTVD